MSLDPVLITSLTASTVSLLTNFLVKAGEGFAGATGEGAWNATAKLFDLVRSKLKKTSTGETALDQLRTAPTDETSRAAFSADLKAQLESDSAFRTELAKALIEAKRAGAGVTFNVINLGHIEKLIQIGTVTGDVHL